MKVLYRRKPAAPLRQPSIPVFVRSVGRMRSRLNPARDGWQVGPISLQQASAGKASQRSADDGRQPEQPQLL